jgi:hypothetical protein
MAINKDFVNSLNLSGVSTSPSITKKNTGRTELFAVISRTKQTNLTSSIFNDGMIVNNFTASVNNNIINNITSSCSSSVSSNVYLNFTGDLTTSRRDVYRKTLTSSINPDDELEFSGLDSTGLNLLSDIDFFWGSLMLEPNRDYEFGSFSNRMKMNIDIPTGDNLILIVYGQRRV